MNLYHLMYISTASSDLGNNELENIASFAAKRNKKIDITGLLLFIDGIFLQVLEGNKEDIEYTYSKIEKDNRHYDLILLDISKISERCFPDWSMGLKILNNDEVF